MSTVWREGGVSVTLTGDLEAWAVAAMKDATNGAVTELEAILEPIAAQARAAWYGPQGVQRRSGLSGMIDVITTANVDKGIVTVSIGSTDTRPAGKRGALVPSFVHRARPGAPTRAPSPSASKVAPAVDEPVAGKSSSWYKLKGVSRDEFFKVPQAQRVGLARVDRPAQGIKAGDWIIRLQVTRPVAGKTLLPIYVNKPAKEAVSSHAVAIGAVMAANMGRKNG